MRIIKWLLKILLILMLILGCIMLFRALRMPSKQIKPFEVEKKELRAQAVTVLSKAIQCPTVSKPQWIDTTAFLNLDSLMVERFPLSDSLLSHSRINQFSHIYEWEGKNPELKPILLIAHLDVVPVDKDMLDIWTHPPFSGHLDGEYIWGRGSLDDKLSAFGILEASEMLLKEGFVPERSIFFAFGHDEEISGLNGAVALSNYLENRNLRFEYLLDEGLVVLENALAGLDKPVALIGVAEKGYATFELSVDLKEGGHSSMPPKETAIGMLSSAIHAIQENPFQASIDGTSEKMFEYIGPEMDFFSKLGIANQWLTESFLIKTLEKRNTSNALIRTTVAPTIIESGFKENVMPSRAKAVINTRIKPGESIQTTIEYIKKQVNNPSIEISLSSNSQATEPPEISSSSSFGFNVIQKTAQSIFPDVVVAPSLVIATTDSRYYTELAEDVYRFLPVQLNNEDLKRIHGNNERLALEAYSDVVNFYYHLMRNSCE